jgi:hypothetical protein
VNPTVPGFNRVGYSAQDSFASFKSKKYIAFPQGYEERVKEVFGDIEFIDSEECAFITKCESEAETDKAIGAMGVSPLSKIRFL